MKVGGRWVVPQEIEEVLTEHPAVAEAAVAPFTKDGLTKPMAFVVLRTPENPSPDLEHILSDHVANRLAPYKAPRFVEVVERLPRGDRDKLDRKALAERAEAVARGRTP